MSGIMDLFGPSQNPGYSKGDLSYIAAQRENEINNFSNDLATARQQYLGQIQQLQTQTFANYFGPDLVAKMGANGFNPNGGAVAAGLSKYALQSQASLMQDAYGMQRQDVMAVDQARAGVSGQQMQGGYGNMTYPTNPTTQLGSLASQVGMAYLGNQFNMSRDQALINGIRQSSSSPQETTGVSNNGQPLYSPIS